MEHLTDDEAWQTRVRAAVMREDREVLRELYGEAVLAFGQDIASRKWLQLMSGFDARAITG